MAKTFADWWKEQGLEPEPWMKDQAYPRSRLDLHTAGRLVGAKRAGLPVLRPFNDEEMAKRW
jgi:hypothetical protein